MRFLPDRPIRPRPRARLAAVAAAIAMIAAACSRGTSGPGPASSAAGPRVVWRFKVAPASFALPAPVSREVAVMAGDRVYLAGGLDASGQSASGVFALNPGNGRIVQLGSVPDPFHDAAGAVIGARLFIFGGGAAQATRAVQAFDLATRTGSVVGSLPVPLSDLAAVTVGSTVYLIGGYDGQSPQSAIYATTDGLRFRRVGTLPEGLRYPAAAAVGSTIVVAGGVGPSGPASTVEAFDVATGRVATIGRLPRPVAHAAAIAAGGEVYVVGGAGPSGPVATVTRVDPSTRSVRPVAPLSAPLANAGVVSDAVGGMLIGGDSGGPTTDVLQATMQRIVIAPPRPASGTSPSPGAGSTASYDKVRPFAGLMVIADRGNDRLLVVNAAKRIVWEYPSPSLPAPPFRFYFPDDAFFVHGGHAILVNQEENNVLIEIAYPSGRVLWTYGHPGVPGSSFGYVHQPDDLYPWPATGGLVVADAENCRILFFGPYGKPRSQIGQTGNCTPGLPRTVGYPNGDTPLRGGNLLITQINGAWVNEVTPTGQVIWGVQVPGVSYPSDPQPVPGHPGVYLVADFAKPGRVVEFRPNGTVLWSYGPSSGPGMLDHPSLAAPMPNGLIAITDDYHDRVVLLDPVTRKIVWQYGVLSHPGTAPGLIRLPDGLDLLYPNGVEPLHVDFASATTHPGRP